MTRPVNARKVGAVKHGQNTPRVDGPGNPVLCCQGASTDHSCKGVVQTPSILSSFHAKITNHPPRRVATTDRPRPLPGKSAKEGLARDVKGRDGACTPICDVEAVPVGAYLQVVG